MPVEWIDQEARKDFGMTIQTGERDLPLVLVVDDDTNARFLVRECLEQAGFTVEEAQDGIQGLRAFERRRPEMVLLDVIMPNMDGFAACVEIRKLNGGALTPILMMTGLEDRDSIRRAYEAGATDFITKPINWHLFPQRVRYLLRSGRAVVSLLESEERYRLHFENVCDVVYSVDRDFKITSMSPSVERVLGYKPEELIGKTIRDVNVLEPTYLEASFSDTVRVLSGERVQSSIYEFRAKDGKRRFGEVSASPLVREGNVVAVVCVARDITDRKLVEEELRIYREHLEELVQKRTKDLEQEVSERKRIEEEIRHLNDKLEERVKERTEELERALEDLKKLDGLKDAFLSSVSHELRTPLTSIRSFSEILLNYDDVNEDARKEFVGIINSESQRLTRLINDVLDISRIEAEKMVWHDIITDLGTVIQDVARVNEPLLKEKSLRLSVDVSPGLPMVFVDPDRFRQVITNLLSNAIKFSHEGTEIRVLARVFAGKRSGDVSEWINVSISDQGIGIEEKDFEIIFDKFRQVSTDTLRDKPKGTGLGLSICKDIILHYGGRIWVQSKKGEGSTFSFTLPAVARTSMKGAG